MEAEIISTRDALLELEPDWTALYERAERASPFQHPSWLVPWWNTFGSGELLCLAFRIRGRLVGLAPMFLHWWNDRRQVTFLGTGASDRLGFLSEAEYQQTVTEQVADFLDSARERWDLCDLQDLPPDFELAQVHRVPLPYALRPQYTCARIPLPGTCEDFERALPHGLSRNLRRYRDKLQALGEVGLKAASSEQEFRAAIDALFFLHGARWRTKQQDGMMDGTLEKFHREAALRMWARGKARGFTLSLEGRAIAVVYGFLDKERFWAYQSGFDPSLARFSPGSLLLQFSIEAAIREGARQFDFLRGGEEYKRAWGAQPETSQRLLLWHRHPPADLLLAS
jgi:CelD/BcsL family acetyltransferase involved in cellulose biosynthesis